MCPAIFNIKVPLGCSSVKSDPFSRGSPFIVLEMSLGKASKYLYKNFVSL
jgi:hypothetical protein